MSNLKLPSAWLNKPQTTTKLTKANTRPTQVKAKLDMSEDVAGQGLCPDCKKQMERIIVNDHPTMTCMNCRICMPINDSQLELENTPALHETVGQIPVSSPPKNTTTVKEIQESLAPMFRPHE